jgi:flagellar biosynthesis protein FlhG
MVSANLGVALAQAGYRVLLVDADLGGANLHTCLGVPQPNLSLSDYINRRVGRLEELVTPAGVNNLSLISGALDVLDAANPRPQQKTKLIQGLQGLSVDYLVLDLGAGTGFNVLDFFLIANHGLLVILPEPTSVENAYRFVKAAVFRKLQNLADEYGIGHLVETVLNTKEGLMKTPFDIIAHLRQRDMAAANRLEMDLKAFRTKLVVNQVRSPADAGVGHAVVAAWKRFFGLEMDYLGAIPYDDEAWRAVRKKRPVLLERPESFAANGLRNVAARLTALDGGTVSP